jgi:phospholipase C
MFRALFPFLSVFLLAACSLLPASPTPTIAPTLIRPMQTEAPTLAPTFALSPTATPVPLVPDFDYIVVIVFENKEFGTVIGNSAMPVFNRLAQDYTLLTQHFAVTHPSLPNYISMLGGDTFDITRNCEDCFIDAPSLPDLIETSGRTWKTYQEDMPAPCFLGSKVDYAQKHNPFVYFDPIRLDSARCERSVRPLTDLYSDLAAGSLPNFVFITPNLCNDSHDCGLDVADAWLDAQMQNLLTFLNATGDSYLIILTWDEGQGDHSCCGLPEKAGGRVATILISPQVKNGFEDATPYTHYSLLKTIAEAWGLPYLGHAADENNALIVAPWK